MAAPQHGIYCLIDPRDLSVKYVGQSENLKQRASHWRWSFSEFQGSKALLEWFDDMGRNNCEPRFEVLCYTDVSRLNEMERYWYNRFSKVHVLLQDEKQIGSYLRINQDDNAYARLQRLKEQSA
jgi:hypothetical protein